MKECRFNKYDIEELSFEPVWAELQITNRLKQQGFDLDKPIETRYDIMKNEYIYTQKQ